MKLKQRKKAATRRRSWQAGFGLIAWCSYLPAVPVTLDPIPILSAQPRDRRTSRGHHGNVISPRVEDTLSQIAVFNVGIGHCIERQAVKVHRSSREPLRP